MRLGSRQARSKAAPSTVLRSQASGHTLSEAQTQACRPLPAADASAAASAQAAPPRAPEGATCELFKTATKWRGDIGDSGKDGGTVGGSGLLASSVLCL